MSYVIAGLIGSLIGATLSTYYGVISVINAKYVILPLIVILYAPIGALVGNFIGLGGLAAYELISRRLQKNKKKMNHFNYV